MHYSFFLSWQLIEVQFDSTHLWLVIAAFSCTCASVAGSVLAHPNNEARPGQSLPPTVVWLVYTTASLSTLFTVFPPDMAISNCLHPRDFINGH